VGGIITLAAPKIFPLLAIARLLVGSSHHTVSHLPYLLGKNKSNALL
jgi:hypothetical protein